MTVATTIEQLAKQAKQASRALVAASAHQKNRALLEMADRIVAHQRQIAAANQQDLAAGESKGLSAAMLDRLRLTEARIESMAQGLREVAALPDPVGELTEIRARPSGIRVGRMRIPLGLVAIIYESRPNVTADAAGLCLKSGNAVLLRGGSEAFHSNHAIAQLLQGAAVEAGLPAEVVSIVDTVDRQAVLEMLKLEDVVDVVIPRGGEALIRFVAEHSRVPVIKHYKGTCHVYVDRSADLDMACRIAVNAKTQRPGVCNAAETLLVHRDVAAQLLPRLGPQLTELGVELRGCPRTLELLLQCEAATEEDWPAEYLDLVLAIKVVQSMGEAIDHISQYGSHHTEAIVTTEYQRAMDFVRDVDSSSVMVNASTRFADGSEYGLGAEIGISTSKLHAYGPMGLRELTSQKFVVLGDGQIRS